MQSRTLHQRKPLRTPAARAALEEDMLTDRELQTMRNLGGFSEDAADEIAALRAEVAALTENGPPMQRGTTIEGTPWMGTMREVLEDYKSAADTEAKWGDEARAEVAGLRSTLADSRAYVERLKKRIDEMMTERDVRIKVLEDALTKIDAIRNDIIGRQKIGWSSHVYPLVAALDEAGYPGLDYDAARAALGDKTCSG